MENILTEDGKNIKLANGALMPAVGLGTFPGDHPEKTYEACVTAFKYGYRLLDCAFLYQNEAEVGRAVADSIKDGLINREDIFVTNKLWCTMHNPEDVQPACERSLKTMGLKYFDLYLIHWPFGAAKPDDPKEFFKVDAGGKKVYDPVPITDTWKALESLVDLGLCKAIGVSNFNINQMERILAIAKHPLANSQVESHLYLTQNDLVKFCSKHNISVTAYSPLFNPSRSWKKEGDPAFLVHNKTLVGIGKKYGKSAAQVLLRFQVQRGVAVVPKSFTPLRMASNIDIFDFKLSDEDMKILHGFNINYRVISGSSIVEGMENHPEFPW